MTFSPLDPETAREFAKADARDLIEAEMEADMNGPTIKRGFAAMSPDRLRELAAKGGKSVPPGRRGFARDPAAAVEAGRKGGLKSRGGGRPPGKAVDDPPVDSGQK